jgi:hypothetical protein
MLSVGLEQIFKHYYMNFRPHSFNIVHKQKNEIFNCIV